MTLSADAPQQDTLLDVRDLRTHIVQSKTTVKAVDGVSFSVAPGETLGIVGESGCGKTMTALSILGLLPAGGTIAGGSIRLEGTELVGLAPSELRARRGALVGMIFQNPMTSLNPSKTIGWQVGEALRIHYKASRKVARDRAIEVLSLVGIPHPKERVDDFPHQLSGGMRQRVMIAIALACEPKLLIADEPTTALDVTIQAQILSLLDDLKERLGMGLVLVTHDLGVIAGRADRVLVMYAGRVVEEARTKELFAGMRHPYTQALLASIPRIGQDRRRVLATISGLPPDLSRESVGCRFAQRCQYSNDHCRNSDPKLVDTISGHSYACFYPVDGPLVAPKHSEVSLHKGRDLLSEGPSEALVSVEGLVKEFTLRSGILQRNMGTVHAVSSVSFEIQQGETFGIVGESGCGKTTLGRMMVGLETPTAGAVRFKGLDINSLSARELRHRRGDFQLMFQDPYSSLDPRMRIRGALAEPLSIQGVGTPKERLERISFLVKEVGLRPEVLDRYPHEFSGGQRQRIGFARALMLNPRLIVADEPVSALDVSIRSQIMNMMRRLQDAHQLTYAVISHDLSVVSYLADRVGVMYLGRIVEIGTTIQVFTSPAHPYTHGLLRSVPFPDPVSYEGISRQPAIVGELPSPVDPPSGCHFRTRCPMATDRCTEEMPLLRPIENGHEVACHFAEKVIESKTNLDLTIGSR